MLNLEMAALFFFFFSDTGCGNIALASAGFGDSGCAEAGDVAMGFPDIRNKLQTSETCSRHQKYFSQISDTVVLLYMLTEALLISGLKS